MPKAKFAQVVKFVFYKKATKCCKISTLLLSVCTVDKSKVEISQKILAFSEYMNFKYVFERMNENIDDVKVSSTLTYATYIQFNFT